MRAITTCIFSSVTSRVDNSNGNFEVLRHICDVFTRMLALNHDVGLSGDMSPASTATELRGLGSSYCKTNAPHCFHMT